MNVFKTLFLLVFIGGSPLSGIDSITAADPEYLFIQGKGYPPIKAVNKTQALLMARRAAILDAYRNALKSQTQNDEGERAPAFSERVSGFIRGMTVTDEIYLPDGGVQITSKVKASDIFPESGSGIKPFIPPRSLNQIAAVPGAISLEQWYKTIETLVTFEKDPKGYPP